MLELYHQTGPLALGSRLRQLGETLAEQSTRVYQLYQLGIDTKWFPVFFMLRNGQCLSISALAEAIGHSHASVSKIVKEMSAAGLLRSEKVAGDGRINQVCLTKKAQKRLAAFDQQIEDVELVVESMLGACENDLWQALDEFEQQLAQEDFYSRVKKRFTSRERQRVEVGDATAEELEDFSKLNYDWIEKFFQVEDSDRVALDDPQAYILDKGGVILMARYAGKVAGTCALMKAGDETFELAKMAVADEFKGRGIGLILGQAVLHRARELGARRVFLDSNTSLTPAINLYRKLGFKRIDAEPSPYARCNIQMEILLSSPEAKIP